MRNVLRKLVLIIILTISTTMLLSCGNTVGLTDENVANVEKNKISDVNSESENDDKLSAQTFEDITITLEEHGNQRISMENWLNNLDEDVYSGIGMRYLNDGQTGEMILYVTDVAEFIQSSKMQEATDNQWKLLVEKGDYSYKQYLKALDELNSADEMYHIEKAELDKDVDNVILVYTSDNSERNLSEIIKYCGIDKIKFPNLHIYDPDESHSYIGYYKRIGSEEYFGRPYVYKVAYEKDNYLSDFYLQYDSPKTDDEINEVAKTKMKESWPSLDFDFIISQIEVELKK